MQPRQLDEVTVVVPMYNVEATIERCITSLKEQSYRSLQVLLIDDGSSDKTVDVAKSLTSDDSRFSIVQVGENRGASAARNVGIERGRGRYLFFVDGDDWLESSALAQLVDFSRAHDADLVCSGHIQERGPGKSVEKDGENKSDRVFTQLELMAYIRDYIRRSHAYVMLVHCWGKLYDYRVVRENDTRFCSELTQLEDVSFNFRYLRHSRRVGFMRIFSYHHRVASTGPRMSAQTGMEHDPVRTIVTAFADIEEYLRQMNGMTAAAAEQQVAHLFVSTAIITIIRLSRTFLRERSLLSLRRVVAISGSPQVRRRLRYYAPGPGESRLLFWALRSGVPMLVIPAGIARAWVLSAISVHRRMNWRALVQS